MNEQRLKAENGAKAKEKARNRTFAIRRGDGSFSVETDDVGVVILINSELGSRFTSP